MSDDTFLEGLQADVTQTLRNVPGLGNVCILADNEGDIEARVAKALSTMTGAEGKRGLTACVLLPEIVKTEDNLPGPVCGIQIEIRTVESVLVNRDPNMGTGLRSSQCALRILRALHQRAYGGVLLTASNRAVKPIACKAGHVSHAVTLTVHFHSLGVADKTPAPTAELDAGALMLTCADSTAAIYTTTDGSYPAPTNPAAALYSDPIADLTSGTLIRACAIAPSKLPSDVPEISIS